MSQVKFTLEDGRAVTCNVEPVGAAPFNEWVKSLHAQLEEGTLAITHSGTDYQVVGVEVVQGEGVPN